MASPAGPRRFGVAVVTGPVLASTGSLRLGWPAAVLPYLVQPWAGAVLARTLLGGLAYAIWQDGRGLWAALILSPPVALLVILPRRWLLGGYQPGPIAIGIAIVLLAEAAARWLAIRLSRYAARLRPPRPSGRRPTRPAVD